MMMSKDKYLKVLNEIKEEYDAFYFENKYGTNTHDKQFALLDTLDGQYVHNALAWIRNEYDCYYKNELSNDSPFAYLEGVIYDQ